MDRKSIGVRRRLVRAAALAVVALAVMPAWSAGQVSSSPGGWATGPVPPPMAWVNPGTLLNPGSSVPAALTSGLHAPPRDLRANYWVVQTRACPQVMGSEPWPGLLAFQFDGDGLLVGRDPADLVAQSAGRPVLFVVHGNMTTPEVAINGGSWTHQWLLRHGALPADAMVVAFDWPSDRVFAFDLADIEEKARRAYVAGYHLARFLQAFPPGSRVCLLGQSLGARVCGSALHLLGGGGMDSQSHDPMVSLPAGHGGLHLRGVLMGGANDHDWLVPGKRLDRAVYATEALLNLNNRCDGPLTIYPLARRTGHHPAIGKRGLTGRDMARIGPPAARIDQRDMAPILGSVHTLLGAVSHPTIAGWIAPYAWACGF